MGAHRFPLTDGPLSFPARRRLPQRKDEACSRAPHRHHAPGDDIFRVRPRVETRRGRKPRRHVPHTGVTPPATTYSAPGRASKRDAEEKLGDVSRTGVTPSQNTPSSFRKRPRPGTEQDQSCETRSPLPDAVGRPQERPSASLTAAPTFRRCFMELMDMAGTLLILLLAVLIVRAVNRGGGRIGG